jgi:hypothetical protein
MLIEAVMSAGLYRETRANSAFPDQDHSRLCAFVHGFLPDFWWQERQAIGQLHQAMSEFEVPGKAEIPRRYPNVAFDPQKKLISVAAIGLQLRWRSRNWCRR